MSSQVKSKLSFFVNPFERIAGWQALLIGLAVMSLTAIVGKINRVAFDGVLDVHAGAIFSYVASFVMQAVNLIALFLTMWLAGVLFSKSKLRAIDVVGTMALARFPYLLLALVCFLPVIPTDLYDIPRIIIFTFISLPFIIWMVVLMYKAFSVSCNMKGGMAIAIFAGALLVAEIISKIVIFVLAGILFINSPGISTSDEESKEEIVQIDSLSNFQKTENIVKAFENGDFKAIPVYFDETMKKALPTTGLMVAWEQLNLTFGKFEKADIVNFTETTTDGYNIIEVPFTFQKSAKKLRLVFNGEGKVSGLFFQ
ncbi:MAG: DUF3887 domain-containing protein [Tannerella sp.]|jgi:hypothetical protein|nr:DUF3887 domain-containing protein [Tannerella sp.]